MWNQNRFDRVHVANDKSSALTDDQLRKIAPSIFAETPWQTMTNKYLFVPTIEIVKKLREQGFMPVRAVQSRTRIAGKEDFTKHMIVFRDVSLIAAVGECVPGFALVNSHDGTSSYQLHGELFRKICANGLIVADTTLASLKFRHAKTLVHDIIEGTYSLIREVPKITEKVEIFKSISLNREEQQVFAEAALDVRYDETQHRPIEAHQLLQTRRREDEQPSLWNIYNRVEENMVKGGLRGRSANNRRTQTRSVAGVSENVRLEKALWSLTERMAALKK